MSTVPPIIDSDSERRFAESVADVELALSRLASALPQVNDPHLRPPLLAFLEGAQGALASNATAASQRANHLFEMRRGIRELEIPSRDPDLGPTPTLEAMESGLGLVAIRLDKALELAHLLGWRPRRPDLPEGITAVVRRSEVGGLLEHIALRLDRLSREVNGLKVTSDASGGPPEQKGLINVYVGSVHAEASLAKMTLRIAERTVDFAALWRTVEAIVELTRDFVASFSVWRRQVSVKINDAVEAVRGRVAATVSGLRRITRTIVERRRRAAEMAGATVSDAASGPPAPEYGEWQARDMILAGHAPPAVWCPLIHKLEFTGSRLNSLHLLANLTGLQTLSLIGTRVSDLSPLAGLIALRSLELNHTRVSDLSPLAGLITLRSLELNYTEVSDLSPLAGLMALRSLDFGYTRVSDLWPLVKLIGLQTLSLGSTRVSDLSPLANLTGLQVLELGGTRVSDLSPLTGLTGLRRLYFSREALDVSVIAHLTGLEVIRR